MKTLLPLLEQRCLLCGVLGVRYFKTKGSFVKVCDSCGDILEKAGLLIEPDVIHVANQGGDK